MINITYKPKTYELELNGHAGHGKKGKDIVCSAISCLFYTLCENLYDCIGMLEEAPIFKDEEGEGYLSCIPREEYKDIITVIYKAIICGMRMVADSYPKHVKFRIER